MKKMFVIVSGMLLAAGVFARPTDEGNYEVRGGLLYNLENRMSTKEPLYVPLTGGMGYYFLDGLQAGGFVTFEKRKWESAFGVGNVWSVGGFAEYVLDAGLPVMPSFGLSLRGMDSDLPSDMVFVFAATPGLRLYITDSVALALQLDVNMASKEIYNFHRSYVDRDQPYPQDQISGSGSRVGFTLGAGVRVNY